MKATAFRLFTVVAVASQLPTLAVGQVFIPDTLERNWLNSQIPGIVDGSGIMDTLNPGIAALDSAVFNPGVWNDTLDLHGIKYLSALEHLALTVGAPWDVALYCSGFPADLKWLHIYVAVGSIHLTELPGELDLLNIIGSSDNTSLEILSMPDSIQEFLLHNLASMDWPGFCRVETMKIFAEQLSDTDIDLPPSDIGELSIDNLLSPGAAYMDLSEASVHQLAFGDCMFYAPITWPSQCENMIISSSMMQVSSWPPTLRNLQIWGTLIDCIPWLPDSVGTLTITTSVDCLPNWPPALAVATINGIPVDASTATYCSILNTDCPGSYPGISGRIFADLDSDGAYDTGEPPLPQGSVLVQPNGHVAGCDDQGYWEIGVLPGTYTITPSTTYPYIQSFSPLQHTANLPNMGDADTLNDFAATLTPGIEDLRAFLQAGRARPGFNNRLHLTCQNYGTTPMDAVLTLDLDQDQTWVTSSITPDALSTTTATWQLNAMPVGSSQLITVDLNTAASVPLGTPIHLSLTAAPTATDETPPNNVVVVEDSVVGSFDPNDKRVRPEALTPAAVAAGGDPLEYTIRFQNTGTIAADRVVILDTLPDGLQPTTIEFLSSSHPCHWYVLENVLYVIHEGINLPDSTSDEAGSHGYFQFRILPDTDLLDGEEVVNIAHIVFDFNEPIITPPAIFRVDATNSIAEAGSNAISIRPNPAHEHLCITLPSDQSDAGYLIQDITGRTMASGRTRGTIEVSDLSSGTYLLRIESEAWLMSTRFLKD